jgi:hypothetical protein
LSYLEPRCIDVIVEDSLNPAVSLANEKPGMTISRKYALSAVKAI